MEKATQVVAASSVHPREKLNGRAKGTNGVSAMSVKELGVTCRVVKMDFVLNSLCFRP